MATKTKSWLLVILCCIATLGVFGGIKFSQISAAIAFGASFPEPYESVLVVNAEPAEYTETTRVVAEVVPVRSVAISNELPGAIVEVGFAPGATVTAGQVMLKLDISEERAQLDAANAREALAERTLTRNESLLTSSAISRQAADDALAARDTARADARRIRAVIEKKTIRAPFAARAGLERWEVGGYLSAASAITTLVGTGDEVWIDFALPQQFATVDPGATVIIDADETGPVEATVIARAPGVDAAARAVRYRASIVDARLAALPGAIVSASVAIGAPQSAMKIPAVAVREDTFGEHVFTLAPAESGASAPYRAVRRAVEVLRVDAETAYIAAGLEAGEQVAAQGAFKLRDGLLVSIGTGAAAEQDTP